MAQTGLSVSELRDRLERARTTAARYRAQAAEASRRTVQGTVVLGGGAAVGLLRGLDLGDVPGLDVSWSTAAGALAMAAGVFDFGGEYSDEVTLFGASMLAVELAPMVERAVRSK